MTGQHDDSTGPSVVTQRQKVRTSAAVLAIALRETSAVPDPVKRATYLAQKLELAGLIVRE